MPAPLRTVLLGIVVNTLLALVKVIAGVLGDSYALIADGFESTLDVFSSLLLWGGLRIATAPADAGHPYGHGKAEPLTALVLALVLLAGAAGLAIQSLREILTPHHPPKTFTLFVLVGVVIAKEALFRLVFRVGESVGSTALKVDAWHHRSDAITSAAAFVGISVALIGGKGYESADDWAALFACGIIAWNGYRLFRPALGEVMDAAADKEIEGRIREIAAQIDGVVALDKCRARKYGLDWIVDLHVVVDGDSTVRQGHEIAHRVKDVLRASDLKIADVLVHIEPSGS
jgi:cation diffusion facilitator family transporter